MKSQGISCRISKVNQQLQKLSNLIQNDHIVYSKTKQALEQFNQEQSSQDSFNYFEFQERNQLLMSKGFHNNKIQVVSNLSEQQESNVHGSTAKSGLSGISALKQSKISPQPDQSPNLIILNENTMAPGFIQGNQSRTADVTVKKFRPVCKNSKKKNSEQKKKQTSKLKNSKSQNKFYSSNKTQSVKKSKKQVKKPFHSNQYMVHNKQSKIYKKMKTSQNLNGNQNNNLKTNNTSSQNRLNQSIKMHINLKKEVNMKITDLNIQKQQCQKQAQYLKSVMKIQQQQKLQALMSYITMGRPSQTLSNNNFTQPLQSSVHTILYNHQYQQPSLPQSSYPEQVAIQIFMGRLLVNFFSQFFNQKLLFCQLQNLSQSCLESSCSCQELQLILSKKNYLIRYMLKLPDILKIDNTLCQERCRRLFEQKHFIDHRIQLLSKRKTQNIGSHHSNVPSQYELINANMNMGMDSSNQMNSTGPNPTPNFHNDSLYSCVDCLHTYISFLINNNVVKQTKRKMLPYEFHSERSGGSGGAMSTRKNYSNQGGLPINFNNSMLNNSSNVPQNQNQNHPRQWQNNSDRKSKRQTSKSKSNYQSTQAVHTQIKHYLNNTHNIPGQTQFVNGSSMNKNQKNSLKRTNTHKMLSPHNKQREKNKIKGINAIKVPGDKHL